MLDFFAKILRCSNLSLELILREETAFAVSSLIKIRYDAWLRYYEPSTNLISLILFNILFEKYHFAVHTCLPNGVSVLEKASMIASIKALCLNIPVRDHVPWRFRLCTNHAQKWQLASKHIRLVAEVFSSAQSPFVILYLLNSLPVKMCDYSPLFIL